jgi:hypothetical protein
VQIKQQEIQSKKQFNLHDEQQRVVVLDNAVCAIQVWEAPAGVRCTNPAFSTGAQSKRATQLGERELLLLL